MASKYLIPSIRDGINIALTFSLTYIAWVFFRAHNMEHAIGYLGRIFNPVVTVKPNMVPYYVLVLITCFVFIESIQRYKNHGLELNSKKSNRWVSWTIYYALGF